jgi:excisionase family DNA binding protein
VCGAGFDEQWLRPKATGVFREEKVTRTSDATEMYRNAERRLRLLLLGDGSDTPGFVKGEESRMRVIAQLRRMRDAFNAAVFESEEDGRAEKAETHVADLQEELLRLASFPSGTRAMQSEAIPTLLTPAEAAQALRMSVGSIYRAVRKGEIQVVKLSDAKRGALRIPASELLGLLQDARP